MNEFKFLPDDPKLTAFALGELEGEERAAIESAVAEDPRLRAVVDDIRATAAQLGTALAWESTRPLPGAKPVARYARSQKPRLLKFPEIYYLVGGLAAACFALVVALRNPQVEHQREEKHYIEVPLPAAAPVAEIPSPTAPAAGAEKPNNGSDSVAANSRNEANASTAPSSDANESRSVAQAKKDVSTPSAIELVPPLASSVAVNSPQTQSTDGALKRSEGPAAFAGNGPPPSAYSQDGHGPGDAQSDLAKDAASSGGNVVAPATGTRFAGDLADNGLDINDARRRIERDVGVIGTGKLALSAGGKLIGHAGEEGTTAEAQAYRAENDFLEAIHHPQSVFSADVDTASYANVRRLLESGRRPSPDAVRIEDLINYFPYAYASPTNGAPIAASLEVAAAPWAPSHRLVRIGLKAREASSTERGPANLVFLIDVSAPMGEPNKLSLVKESLRRLVARLRPADRVAIVTYAATSGLALPSTPAERATEILAVLDQLNASGSANGASGIQLAYETAKANFVPGGSNRVVLCTDRDFNVGNTGDGDSLRLIQGEAKSGVALTVLGFGLGNGKDATLSQFADAGNGYYGCVDTPREADKLLVDPIGGSLVRVAKDVTFQVEFNPAKVSRYRLIGYERRLLKKDNFNRRQVDAGAMDAGQAVTALYEVVPVAADPDKANGALGSLRYVQFASAPARMKPESSNPRMGNGLLLLTVRYRDPAGGTDRKLEYPLSDHGARFAEASGDFKFAAAVAGFGMILRDSRFKGDATLPAVVAWANESAATDAGGYRAEFVGLVRRAETLYR